jgi:Icc protein
MQGVERRTSTLEHAGGSIGVAQLTDTHLCAGRGGTLLGMDTDHSLQAVIDLVRQRDRAPDLVLGTGDMADGGSRSAYRRLGDYFSQLGDRNFFIPGNHDDRREMAAELGEFPALAGEILIGAWQIVLLDSQVPGEVGGQLGPQQLAHLRRALTRGRAEGRYALVCMHHHPVPIGCDWLDEQRIADADELFAVLDEFSGVRALLWGHVHQELDRKRNGVRLLGSPSTCVQFAPGQTSFKADDLPPGYRWLELGPDGRIGTEVVRAEGTAFTVDLEQRGYLDH